MFQNRAALKLVEIDRICDRIFTQPDCWTKSGTILSGIIVYPLPKNLLFFNPKQNLQLMFFFNHLLNHLTDTREPLYFADVCAGPGGFTEYMMYKWAWQAKGFGFTLAGLW